MEIPERSDMVNKTSFTNYYIKPWGPYHFTDLDLVRHKVTNIGHSMKSKQTTHWEYSRCASLNIAPGRGSLSNLRILT